jgi:hypothetical protein
MTCTISLITFNGNPSCVSSREDSSLFESPARASKTRAVLRKVEECASTGEGDRRLRNRFADANSRFNIFF